MQTSKILSVISAALVLTTANLLAAKPETEAQARMREALRLKMEELNAQSTTTPSAAVEVETQKIETPAPATTIIPVPVEAPAPATSMPGTKIVAAPAPTTFSDPITDAEAAKAEQMRQALQKKIAELNAQAPVAPPTTAVSKPAVVIEKPVATPAPAVGKVSTPPAFTPTAPIEAPVSPLPVTKQDRLSDLLRRYKADQISAADYHSQRAALIAEP